MDNDEVRAAEEATVEVEATTAEELAGEQDVTEDEGQAALPGFEFEIGTPTLSIIALDDLPNGPYLPDTALVESIKQNGVLASISVMQDDDGTYAIFDGRRRVMAAKEAGLETIPALVYPASDLYFASSLTMNNVRSDNPVTDLDAITSLLASGESEDSIATALHIPVSLVRRRLKLASLDERLMTALQDRTLGARLAEKIATLSKDAQNRLADLYFERGKLTMKDVKAVVDALNPTGTSTQTTMSMKNDKDWRADLRSAIAKALSLGIALEAFQDAVVAGFDGGEDDE